jgi:hypothetical protein
MVMTPRVLIRPIREAPGSVNQRLPSRPAVIATGPSPELLRLSTGKNVKVPSVLTRPIW